MDKSGWHNSHRESLCIYIRHFLILNCLLYCYNAGRASYRRPVLSSTSRKVIYIRLNRIDLRECNSIKQCIRHYTWLDIFISIVRINKEVTSVEIFQLCEKRGKDNSRFHSSWRFVENTIPSDNLYVLICNLQFYAVPHIG